MKKLLYILIGLAVIGALGFGVWHFFTTTTIISTDSGNTQPEATEPAPPLTQSYTNTDYNFSLMMPAGYTASESQDPSASSTIIAMQNTTGDGIQIVITPFDEDTGTGYTLTKERILQDIPDLTITDEQPVTVGPNYTGLAFLSDNQAFGGASREVWFVFHGNLYQISTYARLDPLLQAIFQTWKFN